MLHQWLSSYQYVASNITAMAIYVNIIQGTSTRGKYTHVKKDIKFRKCREKATYQKFQMLKHAFMRASNEAIRCSERSHVFN